MMYKLLITTILFLLINEINAEGVLVFDAKSIATLKSQLKKLEQQLEYSQKLLNSVQGNKLDQIVTTIDDNIPDSWDGMYKSQGSILNVKDFDANESEVLLKTYNIMRNNYDQAKVRMQNIEKLMQKSTQTEDLKESQDLQNQIVLEQLALQNNTNKMQQLQNMLQKEQELASKNTKLQFSCSTEKHMEKLEKENYEKSGKKYGFKMSPECVEYFKAKDVKVRQISSTTNKNKIQNTNRVTEIKDKNGNLIEKRVGGTISWRNNNPGNVRCGPYARKYGSTGCSGGFAVFPNQNLGDKARSDLIFKDEKYKNLSVWKAIENYAPPMENNVEAYVNTIKKSGVDVKNKKMQDMTPQEQNKILDAMKRHEGWKEGKIIKNQGE